MSTLARAIDHYGHRRAQAPQEDLVIRKSATVPGCLIQIDLADLVVRTDQSRHDRRGQVGQIEEIKRAPLQPQSDAPTVLARIWFFLKPGIALGIGFCPLVNCDCVSSDA